MQKECCECGATYDLVRVYCRVHDAIRWLCRDDLFHQELEMGKESS